MPQKILIVDDDADMRRVLLGALAPLADVAQASNGRDALRRLKAQTPTLMLLDVSMPEMSGIEVLRAARKFAPTLLVVMLTGECDLAVAKKALELGARSYITKPFEVDVVLAEIQRLLEPRAADSAAPSYRPWRVIP